MHINLAHRDCRNFAPIDVVKGLCHHSKAMVAADEPACAQCLLLPKCHHCSHYAADEKSSGLGGCRASDPSRPFMAYADMAAIHCEDYLPRCSC